MDEFIKQNWFKVCLLIIVIITISGSFYWFQLKPSKIKKDCYSSSFRLPVEDRESFYEFCLRTNGLEK